MTGEEEQRCVWQCLYHFPGASNPKYQDCVEKMCVGGPSTRAEPARPAAPARPSVPRAAWKSGKAQSGEHYAGVDVPGGALTFICRSNSGMIGIGGLGGRGDAVEFRVDRQEYGLPFVVRNGSLFTDAPPGSHLVKALATGNAVYVRDQRSGKSLSFPLTGSGAAIRKALAGCGQTR